MVTFSAACKSVSPAWWKLQCSDVSARFSETSHRGEVAGLPPESSVCAVAPAGVGEIVGAFGESEGLEGVVGGFPDGGGEQHLGLGEARSTEECGLVAKSRMAVRPTDAGVIDHVAKAGRRA